MSAKVLLSAALIALATAVGVFPTGEGHAAPGLQLPWPNGVTHYISGNSYGCGTHHDSHHYAIDFSHTFGEAVSAAAAGTVSLAGFIGDGYGDRIVVDRGGGYTTFYAHLQSLAVSQGSYVSQGQVIGGAGASGYTIPPNSPHLHFTAQINGNSYPPEPMSGVRGFGSYGVCGGPSPSWVSRHPYDVQKVTDSTGDGRDDADVFYQANGNWYLAPSNGSSFGTHSLWRTNFGVGSNRQFAADVNNDFKTDAVTWFASTGQWWVSLSTGGSYAPFSMWSTGHGVGSNNQFLADVNQDGKADAVAFFQGSGQWYVRLSNGTNQFVNYPDTNPPTPWITGHGAGSTDQLLGDATGDLRADAIVFFNNMGPPWGNASWFVAPSNGTSFPTWSNWATGHGYTSDRRFIADVNADLKQDAVVFFGGNGSWYVAPSNGSNAFTPVPGPSNYWAMGHGIGSDNQMLADATGDLQNKADAIIYFGQPGQGDWYVAPSTSSAFSPVPPPGFYWRHGYGIGS